MAAALNGAGETVVPASTVQLLAPPRGDARLYRVGGALERLLLDRWGGPLLDRAPQLTGVAGGVR